MIPVCVLCQKFRRQCIYEKQMKTPLTRRHLTEVENELVRTKALLHQFTSQSKDDSNVEFTTPVEQTGQRNHSEDTGDVHLLGRSDYRSSVPENEPRVLSYLSSKAHSSPVRKVFSG